MPWYNSGSVAVSADSATVTGTGTAFSANGRVGDAFRGPDGLWYEVTNIVSATVLSIKPNYQGPTATDQAYALAPMQGYVKESADRLRQFVDQYGATLGSIADWATATDAVAALNALGFSASGKTVASGTPEQGRQALGALSTTGTAADSSKLGGQLPSYYDKPGLGWGQTWQDVTGVRPPNTNYTNTTGRPIVVAIRTNFSTNSPNMVMWVNETPIQQFFIASAGFSKMYSATVIVPDGATYRVDIPASDLATWTELR